MNFLSKCWKLDKTMYLIRYRCHWIKLKQTSIWLSNWDKSIYLMLFFINYFPIVHFIWFLMIHEYFE
jgi:hypothetical protein